MKQVGHVPDIAAVGAGHESSAIHDCRCYRVDRLFHVAEGCAFGVHPDAAGGRNLTCGQTIDLVVHHYVGQIGVSPGGMGEVIATDAVSVSVATSDNHVHLVIGHLYAGGHGQRPAMKSVHAVGIDIAR